MALVEPARVYSLSGAGAPGDEASANSSSLPDLLRRHGRSNKRTKRRPSSKSSGAINSQLDRIELIQDFEFPEASNKIRSTRDGNHLVATGTYKPHIRVWELDQLSLKFERHTDSENIDFIMLSDDWTKHLHLQTDRTLELHSRGGLHTRVRIPKFGRALGYHFPSAEAVVGAAGSEVYRLNLELGRFMAPYQLGEGSSRGGEVTGCNAVDVNPAHGLLAFGTEGAGVVELWDPRARRRAGELSIMTPLIMDASLSSARRGLPGLVLPGEDANEVALRNAMSGLSVSALSSAQDGLNMAVGTSTGHVLLYDLRMDKAYAAKDQGFSLPIKSLSWPGDAPPLASSSNANAHRAASTEARDTILSADAKGIKVWNKNDPSSNLVSISPQSGCDLNDVHHLPGTGLVFAAVEGTQCAAWYVPTLGPAPKWCSFLDRITDEIDEEEASGGKRGVYEDFKFVDKEELEKLDMAHLIDSDVLRPYMHGYFIALPVYERARLLANPSAYSDAREKAIKAKLEKQAESRIRSSGAKRTLESMGINVQVNRDLAEKASREQERQELLRSRGVEDTPEAGAKTKTNKADLLADERFKELFTNPDFEVDTRSRDFALRNPSTAVTVNGKKSSRRTAVEEEEDESDRESLDPDQEEDRSSSDEGNAIDDDDDDDESDASSAAGDLAQFSSYRPNGKAIQTAAELSGRGARLIDDDFDSDDDHVTSSNPSQRRRAGERTLGGRLRQADKGQRRRSAQAALENQEDQGEEDEGGGAEYDDEDESGGRSMTWTPSGATIGGDGDPDADYGYDDEGRPLRRSKKDKRRKRKPSTNNAGGGGGFGPMAKRTDAEEMQTLPEMERSGRKKRRQVDRSASKNSMRR